MRYDLVNSPRPLETPLNSYRSQQRHLTFRSHGYIIY